VPHAEDVDALVTLLARYCNRLDRGDHEGFADLFTADGRFLVFGRAFEGRAGLLKMATTAPAGIHIAGTPVLDVRGDEATGEQNFVFVDAATHALRVGFYDDDLVRTPDGWRIRSRRVTFMTAGGPSEKP
jgi:hypothetical protein